MLKCDFKVSRVEFKSLSQKDRHSYWLTADVAIVFCSQFSAAPTTIATPQPFIYASNYMVGFMESQK